MYFITDSVGIQEFFFGYQMYYLAFFLYYLVLRPPSDLCKLFRPLSTEFRNSVADRSLAILVHHDQQHIAGHQTGGTSRKDLLRSTACSGQETCAILRPSTREQCMTTYSFNTFP